MRSRNRRHWSPPNATRLALAALTVLLTPLVDAAHAQGGGGLLRRSETYSGCASFGDCYTVTEERWAWEFGEPMPPASTLGTVSFSWDLASPALTRPTMFLWNVPVITCCSHYYPPGPVTLLPLAWGYLNLPWMDALAMANAPFEPTFSLRVYTPDPNATVPPGATDLRPYSIEEVVTLRASFVPPPIVTPEPTTVALMAWGLFAVGVLARRRGA